MHHAFESGNGALGRSQRRGDPEPCFDPAGHAGENPSELFESHVTLRRPTGRIAEQAFPSVGTHRRTLASRAPPPSPVPHERTRPVSEPNGGRVSPVSLERRIPAPSCRRPLGTMSEGGDGRANLQGANCTRFVPLCDTNARNGS